jgi:hypothetical protein
MLRYYDAKFGSATPYDKGRRAENVIFDLVDPATSLICK